MDELGNPGFSYWILYFLAPFNKEIEILNSQPPTASLRNCWFIGNLNNLSNQESFILAERTLFLFPQILKQAKR